LVNVEESHDENDNFPSSFHADLDSSRWPELITTRKPREVASIHEGSPSSYNNGAIKHVTTNTSRDILEIALNCVLWCSSTTGNLLIESIVYPWDLLRVTQKILHEEVKSTIICPNTSIAKTSILDGPCIIEDNVTIDDFCKIKGPAYIGNSSFIGMSSLIRNCMFGDYTHIGFNCEIGKSYFVGHDKIAHQNVILDSLVGKNVWFGGYSGTANVLLTRKNIRYDLGDGKLVDTKIDHFGALVGNNCAIGASTIILPGRHVPPNTTIQAGTIVGKKEQ
jgi:UDP-N-acetylglucosamine diphosphorylase / glucose-1-phosphate thymidylyltransferase / UDP-N-acetylgalactosamine diphosphorylase / glucosamine-1-phosphate N-acetyltransferase / galactosamine-1-phosphate N-acetyltransferase